MPGKKSNDSEQLVVRLDVPCHPSTRLAETAELKGWFLAPKKLAVDEIEETFCLDVLCETEEQNRHPERKACALSASAMPRESTPGRVHLEEIKLTMGGSLNGARKITVAGRINISSLVGQDSESATRAFLSLIVSHGESISVSNTVEILVQPRESWEAPYGGFLFPRTTEIASEYLVIEGWALKKSSRVAKVDLLINGRSIGEANSRLWNSEIGLALPDPEDAFRGMFNLVLKRSLFAWLPLNRRIVAEARVSFDDGSEFSFSSLPFRWMEAERERLEQPFVRSALETVKLLADGRVELEGWMVFSDTTKPRFLVSGIKQSVALFEVDSADVEWFDRPEVASKFPERAVSKQAGFRLALPTSLVGNSPGELRLYVSDSLGKLHAVGSKIDWAKWSKISAQANLGPGLLKHSLAAMAYGLSAIGVRAPSVRVADDKSAAPKERSVMFATHNLSSMEGAPRVLRQVVDEYLSRVKNPERVIVVSPRDGELRKHFEAQGAQVFVVEELSAVGQSFERYNLGQERVINLAKERGVSTIYANVIDSFWAIDLGLRQSIQSIWAIHECVDAYRQFEEFPAILRSRFLRVLREAPEFIFVSQASANSLSEFTSGANVRVVPNGLDIAEIENIKQRLGRSEARESLQIKENEKVVSMIGVTAEHKGQDVFIKEMSELVKRKSDNDYRFFIVGARHGEYLERLKREVESHGLSAKLSFVEETPEVATFYRSSDLIVVASRTESCPLVPLEAFAFEVPVVSTLSQGLAEQIRDRENALAFSEENEGALSRAVELCLDDSDLRSRLVKTAYQDVRQRYDKLDSLEGHLKVLPGGFELK